MQTFVPSPDDSESTRVLDDRRLLKQIVECSQILKAISTPTYGWQNHPAVRMWRGSPARLANYAWAMQAEYFLRRKKFVRVELPIIQPGAPAPSWWGGPIHASHRANLLRKAPAHYAQFGWTEDPAMPYVWPA